VRYVGWVAMLVLLWVLAWGEINVANVVSGIAAAAALLLVFPLGRRHGSPVHLNPIGIARLAVYVATQLVTSNVVMTRQILRRRDESDPGIVAHHLQRPSAGVITVMSSIIALSPGTMTVDVDADASTIYVHFFRLRDVPAARRSLARLEHLIVDALGRPAAPGPQTSVTKETS
jgi:multicomponent Na+:H+ antiporter subunit E